MQAAQDKEEALQPCALHGSSASSPPCQEGSARALAGPGCRHRVNPEWLVRCCRDLA